MVRRKEAEDQGEVVRRKEAEDQGEVAHLEVEVGVEVLPLEMEEGEGLGHPYQWMELVQRQVS